MALIALSTQAAADGRINVVGKPEKQYTAPAAEAIVAGAPVRLDTTSGKWTNSNGTTAPEARVWGIALHTVAANGPLTVVRCGILDGFVLDSQAFDLPIFVSDTDGRLGDAAGTVSTVIGRVISSWAQPAGVAADKLLSVEL